MVAWCRKISESAWFQHAVIALIILGAVLVGVETNPAIMARYGTLLHAIDFAIVLCFTAELIIRLIACGRAWPSFFRDGWNLFDTVVVAVCLLPLHAHYAAVLRLFRVLRVLRLVTRLPKLQLLVGALLKCIPSMGYVGLLLSLLFYIYAVLGVSLFSVHDATHFGTLPAAFLTLFQVVTMEGWVDIMRVQVEHHPVAAPAYFITFIMVGTMVILNLVIGVIMNSMTEMHDAIARETVRHGGREAELARIEGALREAEDALRRLRTDDK
jgi:voltage-gated sodium channel